MATNYKTSFPDKLRRSQVTQLVSLGLFFSLSMTMTVGCTTTPGMEGVATEPGDGVTTESITSSVPPTSTQSPTSTEVDLEVTATPTETTEPPPISRLTPGLYVAFRMWDPISGLDSLYLYSVETKKKEIIVPLKEVTGGITLSPDGRTIIFDAYVSGSSKGSISTYLWMLDIWTKEMSKVEGGDNCNKPTWSPEYGKLAVACHGRDNVGDIFVLSLSDAERINLTAWQEAYEDQYDPAWSPDGAWIAYYNDTGYQLTDPRDGIYIANTKCLADTATCRSSTIGPLQTRGSGLSWSPDSRLLAFGNGAAIQIFDIDKRSQYEIKLSGDVDSLSWSPDGEWIAVSMSPSSGDPFKEYIYLVSEDGQDLVPIVKGQGEKTVVFWMRID